MDTTIPFYSNTPDNTHCFQAAIRMVLKHFYPNEEYSWEQLETITGKKEGLWTWNMAGMIWMQHKGFNVLDIEMFDYNLFIETGEQYLLDFFGKEAGEEQIRNSDVRQERKYAQQFVTVVEVEKRIPGTTDIIQLLDKGYLLIICLNQNTLNNKGGYVGHFVVVKGYDNNQLIFHDPGLPPYENRKESFELFEKAWGYPNDLVRNIYAFKPRNNI